MNILKKYFIIIVFNARCRKKELATVQACQPFVSILSVMSPSDVAYCAKDAILSAVKATS
jgi:hypothetical protein